MELNIKQYWLNIKNSLWFIPTLMAISAIVLAFGFLRLDNYIMYKNFPVKWLIYGGQGDGARSVLSTIASSMVAIAGVTFSITLVALTMASSQFGPRLLRNFISDKGNQFVIGTFISTFIYSLIVLLSIQGSGNEVFVPKISVIFAFLLAILSLGVIIYFIHHVSTSIQADFIIKSSYNELKKAMGDFFLDEKDNVADSCSSDSLGAEKAEYILFTKMYFNDSGFVQDMNYVGAFKWAERNDALIEWLTYPGSFATVHHVFAVVHHRSLLPSKAEQNLRNLIVTGVRRTPNQDILFPLRQIVEVGVRALSPGINDPHTTITCIQWIGVALSDISKKEFGSTVLCDKNKNIRVIKKQITYQDIVNTCFDQIRLYAKSNIYVALELLDAIKKPLQITKNQELRNVLQTKAADIYLENIEHWNEKQNQEVERSYLEIMQLDQPTMIH